MAVYVDTMKARYGRMFMCHMLADTRQELLAMATIIGVRHKWIQRSGTVYEHFDVCQAKKALAIQHGAIEVSRKEFLSLILKKRGRVTAKKPSPK